MVEDPDVPLVERARGGDRDAANELVARHRAMLERILGRYLRNPADVSEIAQDTFVRAFDRLDSFRGTGPFRAWLFRIGVNLAINCLNAAPDLESLDVEDDELFTNSLGTSRLVAADLWRRVEASMRTLPAKQRMVLELRLYHQLSFEEIGDVVGISTDSAKMNFHHGVKRLRDVVPRE